jgi:hypothetical protein
MPSVALRADDAGRPSVVERTMIDVAQLIASVMTVLAPYLPSAAEGFAKAAGTGAFEGAAKLLKGLVSLFRDDGKAAPVLSGFSADPELYRGALEKLLQRRTSADAAFAGELLRLVEDARATIRVDQTVEQAATLTGIRSAEISRGDVRVEQRATAVGEVTGIDQLTIP